MFGWIDGDQVERSEKRRQRQDESISRVDLDGGSIISKKPGISKTRKKEIKLVLTTAK